jgi:hypothetical protein
MQLDDELRPEVARVYREWIARIARLIEDGRADGSLPASPVDVDAIALRLAAALDGLDSLQFLGLLSRSEAEDHVRVLIEHEVGS